MGLSKIPSSAPVPKIAMVSPPSSHLLPSGEAIDESAIDLVVRAISVGQPHRAVPITVAAAANLEGSTVRVCLAPAHVDLDGITLGHSSGKIMVGANFNHEGRLVDATVFRTARRLMDGFVY
jgi:2-methylaconitate cis-trans-isomerase PrpF